MMKYPRGAYTWQNGTCPDFKTTAGVRKRGGFVDRKSGVLLVAVLTAACALLIFPAQAAEGAKNGVNYSLNILLPSLYPFMVLSVFIVKSGLAEKLGSALEKPTQALFRLPGGAAASIVMSVVGGYPAGARSAAALAEAGLVTQAQAERMMYFCVNAGPSFRHHRRRRRFSAQRAGGRHSVCVAAYFFSWRWEFFQVFFPRREPGPRRQTKKSRARRNGSGADRFRCRRGLFHADDVLPRHSFCRRNEPAARSDLHPAAFRCLLRRP